MGHAQILDVDATTRHAQRARERTASSARKLQAVEHIAEPQPASEVVGLSNILRGGWELTTHTNNGNRAVIKVPHSILAVLVTIAIALVGAGFWLVSSISEMKTNLATIQQSQREIKAESTSNLKLTIAYATNETNRINFLTGMLTKEQQSQLYRYDAANPRPPLPDAQHPDERERNHE